MKTMLISNTNLINISYTTVSSLKYKEVMKSNANKQDMKYTTKLDLFKKYMLQSCSTLISDKILHFKTSCLRFSLDHNLAIDLLYLSKLNIFSVYCK